MDYNGKWIWLSKEKYPQFQTTPCTQFCEDKNERRFCVAEFEKRYNYTKKITSVSMDVCADTYFVLYVNGVFIGKGPVSAGGDFCDKGGADVFYANHYELPCSGNDVRIFARVQLSPVVATQISMGHGGFSANIRFSFEDGSFTEVCTDESWLARLNKAYVAPYEYDSRLGADEWLSPDIIECEKRVIKAPIPMLSFERIIPVNNDVFTVPAGEKKTFKAEFDKIYSASLSLNVRTGGCRIFCDITEYGAVKGGTETVVFTEDTDFTSIQYHSMGEYTLEVDNFGTEETVIVPSALFQCYPVVCDGEFRCSDEKLNEIYDICKWTLRICRQTLHLDSPQHQEPLACTGDYYIESLMTAFTFGDMRLASLDVRRTADGLVRRNGKMFHTTYSLIWVQMLRDVYMFTGDEELLEYCSEALELLLQRFETYIGDNGIIDDPPDYMFVDWVVADEYSLHHPPKALGQTCLNAFYYNALVEGAAIMKKLGKDDIAGKYIRDSLKLKKSYNELLYDSERGLYFDGLNTPTKKERIYHYMPENTDKRYYSKRCNILSVLCGLCEGERAGEIIEKVMNESFMNDIQPYFMHFLFEAFKKCGLYEKYAFRELRRWSIMTEHCSKGLQEGWIKPQEDYSFDHSHAWGGTPAYQLPSAVLGFRMVEPGFRKISLSPSLFDLESAYVKMPTPYGYIECELKKGSEPVIKVPDQIEIV